jgi:bifunctional non-homologous end joining protein LigD
MRSLAQSVIAKVEGAVKKRMPSKIEPMKATLVDKAFSRKGWIFENKWDGVRAVCYLKDGEIELISRNQKDMTLRYPELGDIPKSLAAKEAIFDGEIVVLDKSGRVDFGMLQSRFGVTDKGKIEHLRGSQKIVYYIFDLIYLDGYDLHNVTLLDRKKLLKQVIKQTPKLKYSAHTLTKGEEAFAKAEKAKLEGVMAKNGDSYYEEKRSNEWLKIKTQMRQEVIIVGYTDPSGSRDHFGALHIAAYAGKKLVSLGHVGSGFDRKKLASIHKLMQPLRQKEMPFDEPPSVPSRRSSKEVTHWLKPKLVAEVSFTEFTDEGRLRHPVFEGLRDDKKPSQCKVELEHSAIAEVKQAEKKAKTAKGKAAPAGSALKRLTSKRNV